MRRRTRQSRSSCPAAAGVVSSIHVTVPTPRHGDHYLRGNRRVTETRRIVRRMTITTHPRTHIANGALAEYDAFVDLVAGLSDDQWNAGTRCDRWQVRDVAG